VLPQLRRLEDLGAKSEKELSAVQGVDSAARTMSVPELPAGEIVVSAGAARPDVVPGPHA
jgi:hypothetical protein